MPRSINPATGETIEDFAEHGPDDIERALANAEIAFRDWRRSKVEARVDLLNRIADTLEARKGELGRIATLEMGKRYKEAVAEVEKSEREALEALEGRVGALVDKVGAREADFEKAVRDARAAAGELEAFERDAGTYKLAAGGAAVLLLATTFLASQ